MKVTIFASNSQTTWRFYTKLIAILVLLTMVMTIPYLRSQRVFLGGDINDGFYQLTLRVIESFRQSPIAALQLIYQSFNQNYNKLFSLPLIPFFLLFGNSYLVYVIALAIVYLLTFALVMGAIATQLIPIHSKAVFTSAALITVLLTPNWVTIFQGYPDISGTLVISMAIWVALRGVGTQFESLLVQRWQVPVLGGLLATAILLRRHFAYAVVALLVALLVHTAIGFGLAVRQSPQQAWHHLWQFGLRLVLVLATSVSIVVLLATEFAQRVVTSDYVALYESWSRSFAEALTFYVRLYGWGVWLLVGLGLLAGLLTRILAVPIVLFILTFGGVSLTVWLVKLRYTETYYAIHFVPLIVLGITALLWSIILTIYNRKRIILLTCISLYLLSNILMGLTPIGKAQFRLRSAFAASYSPIVRTNYGAVIQVVDFLRQIAPNQEPIFVVYSGHLPAYLVSAAERTVYGTQGKLLNLRSAALTDSNGFYPIQELLEAEFVVVTDPFLAWHEGKQDAIQTAFAAFTEPWEIAEDFQLLPQAFDLQTGAITRIYQRLHPTSIDRAIRTLHTMQSRVNKPLGAQLDWVVLTPRSGTRVQHQGQRQYTVKLPALTSSSAEQTTLVYVGDLPDQALVRGRVVMPQSYQDAVVSVTPLDEQGRPTQPARSIDFIQTAPLTIEFNGIGAAYLQLGVQRLTEGQDDRCTLKIKSLTVTESKPEAELR
ncbi:hypothetical protein [Thermocoleostomius sinensis]|uniref:Uncharacterized protein n=1 Tax=Thermocoleostomius sinensis A174 TaxID=2016057 RepID=A0A9E8Z8H8_9CYAN|nr:hypothetical protein [Thermocoleostomius sinensis]WAL58450.1 hypothetical protein OXH18_14790 [Thermocoleostomius sinensis A174]